MTEPQAEFFQLQDKYPAFVGGFGTGKTETLANCALRDALSSSDALVALYEPTYDLVRLILAPRMEEKLSELGIRYKYNKQENIIYTSAPNCGDFILRTLENPARIIGYESYRAHVDEIDTLKKAQAALAWRKIIARNRQRPAGVEQPFNRVSAYTTPEGFQFVYDTWGRSPKPGYAMVQAATYTNPFLPDDYVQSLRDSYPAALITAYIEGKFTNLNSGSVYPDFDRVLNHSDTVEREREPLLIGMDFNRLKMSAVVYVLRGGWPVAVAEITDGRDTPYMADLIKRQYADKGHPIQIFPDASGANSSSKNASESDLSILRQAGFVIRVNATNPAIADRVNAVNALILNGAGERRLKINTNRCPHLADGLEQQAYDKNGMPDKSSGVDHLNDAGGYPLAYLFPIERPMTTTQPLRM
ncbi:terminase large subunit domain-containing protein [Pseudomonas sp. MRSN 12121]|uniref:terminase large subunit domain-containing protein n=1 Tax=Pseudomonas sp. MRSN 12121 TaxID=1611770 RepID=UPI0005BEDA2A|nr:terminase family protein [Pseudomonas sp. MRSN 12121]AJO79385.1 terminase [Pseudomonas sp. MRSN 12121]